MRKNTGAGGDPNESDIIQHIVLNIYSDAAVNVSFDHILQWKKVAKDNNKNNISVDVIFVCALIMLTCFPSYVTSPVTLIEYNWKHPRLEKQTE